VRTGARGWRTVREELVGACLAVLRQVFKALKVSSLLFLFFRPDMIGVIGLKIAT